MWANKESSVKGARKIASSARAADRLRADQRAIGLMLAIVLLSGFAFRLTHLLLFAAAVEAALGLYVFRFSRLAWRDPDLTIEAWQTFYSYFRPGSLRSRRLLRAIAVFGLFGGSLLIASALLSLGYSPTGHATSVWFVFSGCAAAALLLLPRRRG